MLESERQNIKQPIQAGDLLFNQLSAQIRSIHEFQDTRLKNLHRLEIDDYPDKLMEIFDDVPQVDPGEVETQRAAAARFVPGMVSLRQSRTLPDPELWIEELTKARNY